jgi:hypothetical protein
LEGIATLTAPPVVAHHCAVADQVEPALAGHVTSVLEPKLGRAFGEADVRGKY